MTKEVPQRVSLDVLEDYLESDWHKDFIARVPAWKRKVYYPIYRFVRKWLNPKYFYREVKWFIQRGKRGWADCDAWDVGHYTARVMRDALSSQLKYVHGWPQSDEYPEFEDWVVALNRLIYGLDHFIKQFDLDETCTCCGKYCLGTTECPILKETFEELIRVWPALWD